MVGRGLSHCGLQMPRTITRALSCVAVVAAAPGTMSASVHACTQPPKWYRQSAGLTHTLLLAESGFEAMVPADFTISPGELAPYVIDTTVKTGRGATGFVVRAVDVAGVDSTTARKVLEESGGRMVLVPYPDFGCVGRDSTTPANAIDRDIPLTAWWPSGKGRVAVLAHLRPRPQWVNHLPTFNIFFGAAEMPYGPSLASRAGYPFADRKAMSIPAEVLFEFLRLIPLRDTLPCGALEALDRLADWEVANPTLRKSQPMKELFAQARRTLKGYRGAAKKKCPACPASLDSAGPSGARDARQGCDHLPRSGPAAGRPG
jgi:hypothetical protein